MAAKHKPSDSSLDASNDIVASGSEAGEPSRLDSLLAVTSKYFWKSADSLPWNGADPGSVMITQDTGDGARAITTQSLENLDVLIPGLLQFVNSSDKTPEMIGVLDQLLSYYCCRHAATGDIEDLENGILYGQQAVSYMYEDDPESASILLNLGTLLGIRYDVTMMMEDLDEAISYSSRAISTLTGETREAVCKANLGSLLCKRFAATQSQLDLDNAISTLRSAVPALPDSQPVFYDKYSNALLCLARVKLDRDGDIGYFEAILHELAIKDPDAESELEQWKRSRETINLQSLLRSNYMAEIISGHETDDDSEGHESEEETGGSVDSDWHRLRGFQTQSSEESWLLETRGERFIENRVRFLPPQLVALHRGGVLVERYPVSKPEDLDRLMGWRREEGRELDEADDEIISLQDYWNFTVDNSFAQKLFQGFAADNSVSKSALRDSARLCDRCNNLDVLSPKLEILVNIIPKPSDQSETCELCSLFHQHLGPSTSILLFKQGSGLKADDQGQPLFRICAEPGPWEPPADVQVGYPVLPDAGSSAYFQLLREWLRVCDNDHDCWNGPDSFLPSRLLDVEGEDAGVPSLRLHISSQGERGRYLVLSHCWGALGQTVKDRYCTYRCNIRNKCEEVSWPDLPKTFQDAVTVARGLGIRYLWIDCLCIIQPHPGCSADCAGLQDWSSEAQKMERYYSQAYATIAATSAPDSTAGFLHPRPAAEFVRVGTAPGGSPLYICASIDNFRQDVDNGLLNKRAWVLQERALSHRTIHMTAAQTYWECGQGIRCETLTKLSNPRASFWSDPQFPSSILSHTKGNRFRLFQHLFTAYCSLAITYPTDRSRAIAGLLERLSDSIISTQHYGILNRFLHRSLLWQRRPNGAGLTRIDYTQDQVVPSWSWMAVHGGIGYMDIPPYKVEWSDAIRFFPGDEDQRSDSDSCLQTDGSGGPQESGKAFRALSRTLTSSGTENPGIVWDEVAEDTEQAANVSIRALRCVALGRVGSPGEEQEHFILVLEPSGEAGFFRRVGVGSVQKKDILFEEAGEEVWVV